MDKYAPYVSKAKIKCGHSQDLIIKMEDIATNCLF